jgi:replication-associated recombination protein RarA
MDDVKHNRTVPVPKHLQQAHPEEKRRLGMGAGYQYAHNAENAYVDQEYLGVDASYYVPTDRGYEKKLGEYLRWLESQRGGGPGHASPRGCEICNTRDEMPPTAPAPAGRFP